MMKKKIPIAEIENIHLKNISSCKAIEEFDRIGLSTVEKTIIGKYFTKNNSKMLDIGCGIGRTTIPLNEMGFNVIGIDISKAMINKAKEKFPNKDFRVGDACDLKFPDDTFDYVFFSFNGIDLIYPEEKRIKALQEIKRVLKYDGIFIFSSHNPKQLIARGVRRCMGHWYWLYNFLILNIIHQRLFSKYKIEKHGFGEFMMYYINPLKQIGQLEDNGFEFLDMFGNFKGKMKYFEPWLYYVAKNKKEGGKIC